MGENVWRGAVATICRDGSRIEVAVLIRAGRMIQQAAEKPGRHSEARPPAR